jgi:cytochrome bd-type quinol oxidase subunit 2
MMQPARFIARLIGPAYLAVGIGILLNGSFYSGLVAEAVKSPTLIYFSGLLALVSGLAILNVHRSWSGWPVLITIIGWLLVIGGAVRLVLPATTAAVSGDLYSKPATLLVIAAILLVVGIILTAAGYRAPTK